MSAFISVLLSKTPKRMQEICGSGDGSCEGAAVSLWAITQDTAEAAYDRSAECRFTTFVGYEHTATPNSNNYHRNVIFRNARLPKRAISYIETPTDHRTDVTDGHGSRSHRRADWRATRRC